MLKRTLSILLVVFLLLGMAGCVSGGGETEPIVTAQPTEGTTGPAGNGEATEPTEDVTEPGADVTDPVVTAPVGTESGVTFPTEGTGDPTVPDVTLPNATDPTESTPSGPAEIEPTPEPSTEAPTEPEITEPPVTEHVHDYSTKVVKPTCTKKGYTQYTCECGDTYKSDYVEKQPHSYSAKVVEPTCEKKGYTKYTCECGESYKDDYTKKVDHVYDGYICTECGARKEDPINGMDIVREALQYLGLNYVLGGNSLTDGTDCSGFTSLIYKKFGISLPRTALDQSRAGEPLSWEDVKPGDLYAVEYKDNPNWTGHAGIYIGNGWLLSAWPNSGVRVTAIGEGDVIRKVFENSYSGTDEDAFQEVHERLFELEMYGEQYRMRYYFDTGEIVMEVESPISTEIWNNISLEVSSQNMPEGYAPAMEAWKKQFEEGKYKPFTLHAYGEAWCYWKGQWYTSDQMWDMRDAGLLDLTEGRDAGRFNGVPWDPSCTIVTGEGEVVDFSTFPTDYAPPEPTEDQ